MGKRIEFDAAAREALGRGVDQLAGAVRVTLGPLGRSVVIDHGDGSPTITNDGATIAREIVLGNRFENMGVQLVKEVALKTAEVAGDGTTTATVLAHSVVREGLRAVAAGHNPMAVKRGIDRAVVAVVESLRRQSRPVETREAIARVGTVSSGDLRIGELIAEAMERVGRHGVITVEEGRGMEITLDVVEGVRFDEGYLSPYFVTDPATMEAVLENPLVLLTEMTFTGARDLLGPLEHAANSGRPLLVVAENVEAEALATLVVNRLRGTVGSVAVKAPGIGDRRRALLEDLAVLTGARLFARDLGASLDHFDPKDLGRARRVRVDKDHTTLIEGGGTPETVRRRVAAVTGELTRSEEDPEREWLRERRGRLTGGIAVIRVGAPTEFEMHERRSRVEDALGATQAAVEEGVVTGGGVALIRAQLALDSLVTSGDERIGVDIVRRALEEPARQIAANAGGNGPVAVEEIRRGAGAFGFNALSGAYEDLDAAGICDPTKVTRSALQNAASIGALVLTTDAIVVDSDEEEPPAQEG
jgi:chaperonin GroEL